MKFAVVRIGKSQYHISEGQELLVDRLLVDKKALVAGDKYSTDQVLLLADGPKIKIGQPTISGAVVNFSCLAETKGPKTRVATYRAKSRSRRVIGFRPVYSRLKVDQISFKTKKSSTS